MARSQSKVVKGFLTWLITFVALYFAFHSINWHELGSNLSTASISLILVATSLTISSYLMRSRRWQFLFAENPPTYSDSFRVLILGFFMNNFLPARTGEFVRAHLGAAISRHTRTGVLATIASERLVDGLTISLMFVAFAFGLGSDDLSREFLYVAYFFGGVTVAIGILLARRDLVFKIAASILHKWKGKTSEYVLDRIQIFINGLSPLYTPRALPLISLWSAVIWFVELGVYIAVSQAFGIDLSLPQSVLFLVAVNFSSLIPAAPGGIGVIEAITTSVLVSIGIDREKALAMVLTQHFIQYLVVGIPGAVVILSWKGGLSIKTAADITSDPPF